jgi:DNA-binding MarR family transcriptional regulator
MKHINVQTLKVDERQFFKVWLTLLQPFLKLRDQELKVLAVLLYYRHTIQTQVKSKTIVDELLFNTKTRKKIKEELNIESYSFNNILSALRKRGLITNNSLNSKIIPNVEDNFDNFKLVYNVEVSR